MRNQVELKELVDALSVQADETCQYLNRETGELVLLMAEELSAAEAGELDNYPDWQQVVINQAIEVIEDQTGKFIELPSKYDIDEYRIMEQFCWSVDDPEISDDLSGAIRGRGAFRRFKDRLHHYGLTKVWYQYLNAALAEIAITWCERNKISYV